MSENLEGLYPKSGKTGKEVVRISKARNFGSRYNLTTLTSLTSEI